MWVSLCFGEKLMREHHIHAALTPECKSKERKKYYASQYWLWGSGQDILPSKDGEKRRKLFSSALFQVAVWVSEVEREREDPSYTVEEIKVVNISLLPGNKKYKNVIVCTLTWQFIVFYQKG